MGCLGMLLVGIWPVLVGEKVLMVRGLGDIIQPPDPYRTFRLSEADIVVPNLEAWALYIDYWILGDASREFPDNSWVGCCDLGNGSATC